MIVALLMVVLPGFTAYVIDVAAMYWEKAQLQNGADAAALGIAQQCAAGECGGINTTATTLAGLNANDGKASAIPAVAGDSVTVTTSTLTAGGENELAHLLPLCWASTAPKSAPGRQPDGEAPPAGRPYCRWQSRTATSRLAWPPAVN